MLNNKGKVILTLDAGGTSFVFSAISDNKEAVEPITSEAFPADLGRCLETMVDCFNRVIEKLDTYPAAISFAFPG
ncbi:MAG: ROK family protein, partial [Fermentimonas sp.]|nr:ROK family protein [Fermentimonas sp.]